MKQPFPIKSESAKKLWQHFEKELDHKIKDLPQTERQDVKLEILSHLYESTINDPAESEENRLINAIERLGSPDEYLTPLVSDILLNLKTKSGNPLAIAQSLARNVQRSLLQTLASMVFGVLYFFIVMIFIMSVAHLFNPDVGLWLHQSGAVSLSFEAHENSTQWMPQWFTVIGLVVSIGSYMVLNNVLYRILRKP